MTASAPKSEALRALYWRSEILRVIYWLYGEGLGDLVDVDLIRRYLDADAHEDLSGFLAHLVDDGSLVGDGDWFALSARGRAEGEVELATAFSDLVHPVVGECAGECWCHMSPAEAEACSRQRVPARSGPDQAARPVEATRENQTPTEDEAGKANA